MFTCAVLPHPLSHVNTKQGQNSLSDYKQGLRASIKDPYKILKQTFALQTTPVLFNTGKSCSQYYAVYDKAKRHQN